jgi:hypothetical protein
MSPGSLETTHPSVTNATQASFPGCPANSDLGAQPLAAHRWKVLKHRIADVMTITLNDDKYDGRLMTTEMAGLV